MATDKVVIRIKWLIWLEQKLFIIVSSLNKPLIVAMQTLLTWWLLDRYYQLLFLKLVDLLRSKLKWTFSPHDLLIFGN